MNRKSHRGYFFNLLDENPIPNLFISALFLFNMEFWLILAGLGVIVVFIWLFSKWNGLKSKVLAIFIIALIVISLVSFVVVFKGSETSIKSLGDLKNAAQIYVSWLGNAFGNVKSITTQTINMDWKGNQTT